jgi:hypothetical protein
MSAFKFTDDFIDLRHWNGTGNINTAISFSGPTSISAISLISKRTFWDASRLSIRIYDNLNDFSFALAIGGTNILTISGDATHYNVTEGTVVTTTTINRSENWHLIEIEIAENYRVSIDSSLEFTSDLLSRRGFDIALVGGIWDNLVIEKDYEDDYAGGTGSQKDLQITDLAVNSDGTISYTVNPGYFYIDDIEYYYFANMGVADIVPNPSGSYVFPSGLPYIPGEPAFIVKDDDISSASGYIKTPITRDYQIIWEPVDVGYQPTISGAYDTRLVYEASEERIFDIVEPIDNTKLVVTDEGGTAAQIRSESAYVDYVTVGSSYQVFAVVIDKYGGPVSGETVEWKRIDSDDTISDLGTSVTDSKGVATKNIVVTESEPFHIYAKVNPTSTARWIRVPLTPSDLQGVIFQLDNNDIYFDSMEARCALGQNIWGEVWGVNPGEATGLSFPYPTTHGQWEGDNLEQLRPPMDEELPKSEALGTYSAQDFNDDYPAVVTVAGDLEIFMNDMWVARRGYWGPTIVSGLDVRNDTIITSGQVLNHDDTYEINRDYAVTSGSYLDVYNAGGPYDSVYYVFYQPGTDYVAGAYDPAGDFYFRGVALYDEILSQANSKVEDLLSDAQLVE